MVIPFTILSKFRRNQTIISMPVVRYVLFVDIRMKKQKIYPSEDGYVQSV